MRKIVVLLSLVTAACGSRASESEWTWKLMKRCWQEGGSFHYWEEKDGKQIVFECHTHNPAKLMFRDVYKRRRREAFYALVHFSGDNTETIVLADGRAVPGDALEAQ
jgi:hypothetical protein